jgi:hypothetical protein
VDRYLAATAKKRSLAGDSRRLNHLKAVFGGDTPLADITAGRISKYKIERLKKKVRRNGDDHDLTATLNRDLAALRHLMRLAHDEWEVLPVVPRIRLEKEPQGRIKRARRPRRKSLK